MVCRLRCEPAVTAEDQSDETPLDRRSNWRRACAAGATPRRRHGLGHDHYVLRCPLYRFSVARHIASASSTGRSGRLLRQAARAAAAKPSFGQSQLEQKDPACRAEREAVGSGQTPHSSRRIRTLGPRKDGPPSQEPPGRLYDAPEGLCCLLPRLATRVKPTGRLLPKSGWRSFIPVSNRRVLHLHRMRGVELPVVLFIDEELGDAAGEFRIDVDLVGFEAAIAIGDAGAAVCDGGATTASRGPRRRRRSAAKL
jgi:hypothetical protein